MFFILKPMKEIKSSLKEYFDFANM